jgi:hypothetical protein
MNKRADIINSDKLHLTDFTRKILLKHSVNHPENFESLIKDINVANKMKISKILYGLNVAIDNLDAVKMTKDVRSQLVSLHSWKERLENRMSRPVSIYEQYQFLQ